MKCKSCGRHFTKSKHNQIYCSKECRREETNKKVLARYYDLKEKRTTRRTCSQRGCQVVLSQYNMKNYCSVHEGHQYTFERLMEDDTYSRD